MIGVVYTVVSVCMAVIVYGTGTRTVLIDVYVVPGSVDDQTMQYITWVSNNLPVI